MATDRDRPNQLGSINSDQEPGLQQILDPSGSGQMPPDQADILAQQSARRKTIYTRTELLSRSLPTLLEQREDFKKDRINVENNVMSSRSSSFAEKHNIKLVEPILSKPVKKIKVLLPARHIRYSCENLRVTGFGNEDGGGGGDNGKPKSLKKSSSEEFLPSKGIEQELEPLSISEMSVTSTFPKAPVKARAAAAAEGWQPEGAAP